MKKCTKCLKKKCESEFYVRRRDNGFQPKCIECVSSLGKIYRSDPQKKKERKEYREKNKEKARDYQKEYRNTHREEKNERARKAYSVPVTKLPTRLNSRFNKCIETKGYWTTAVDNLGCTIPELVTYLEEKFTEGMRWDNHGSSGWHIDHIIPLSSFDLTDPAQVAKACNYKNLQPLWAKDNLSKSTKKQNGINI